MSGALPRITNQQAKNCLAKLGNIETKHKPSDFEGDICLWVAHWTAAICMGFDNPAGWAFLEQINLPGGNVFDRMTYGVDAVTFMIV